MNVRPVMELVQSREHSRLPVRNVTEKVRSSIHSSLCLAWFEMYRLVRGTGYTSSRKKIQVSIPAGIDNGQSIRIRDKGEPGTNGGPRGDLLVEVNVARHPIFQRQDMNIFSTAPLTYAQAALGGEIHINTVDGDVAYEVKPGTQTDTRIRLKGKGVPSLRNKNIRGDHYVTLVVQVPTKLNEEAKEALRKFDEACGNRSATEPKDGSEKSEKKKKSFMDKIKETFED